MPVYALDLAGKDFKSFYGLLSGTIPTVSIVISSFLGATCWDPSYRIGETKERIVISSFLGLPFGILHIELVI